MSKKIPWHPGNFPRFSARNTAISLLSLWMLWRNLSVYKLALANYIFYLTGKRLTCQPFPEFFWISLLQERSFLKFEFFSNLGLTNASSCGIITTVAERSAQKLQMESWLSGRRRTTGNRVTVMSGSRVQIPNSPPCKSLKLRFQASFFAQTLEKSRSDFCDPSGLCFCLLFSF